MPELAFHPLVEPGMARYDDPGLFGADDAMLVSRVAREMLDLFGNEAPQRLKEEAIWLPAFVTAHQPALGWTSRRRSRT